MTVFNFSNLQLLIEIGSSFGMLALSIGALIYITVSKDRVQSVVNYLIFITLTISFSFQATMSIVDYHERTGFSTASRVFSDCCYALQFLFQWLSLLIFTLEYLACEQEVRKVLGMKSTKRKRERYAIVSVLALLMSVIMTYLICNWTGEEYYDSWASSLGEVIVAGSLMTLQGVLI